MNSRWQVRGIALVAVLSLAAGSGLAMAQAQAPTTQVGSAATTTAAKSSHLSKRDKTFLRKAAEGNLAEIELGKLAQRKGGTEAVKAFGERMVTDHSRANDQLMTLAQNLDVQLPTAPSKKDRKEMDKLEKLSAARFDKVYARDMRKNHRMDIRDFEHEAKHGQATPVKQLAESTLPLLHEHLALAEKLPGRSRTASAGETSPTER